MLSKRLYENGVLANASSPPDIVWLPVPGRSFSVSAEGDVNDRTDQSPMNYRPSIPPHQPQTAHLIKITVVQS